MDDKGPPGDEIAEVVERAPDLVIPVGAASATGAGSPFVVPAAPAGLGRGEIFDTEDAYGRVAAVFSGSCHGRCLVEERFPPRDFGKSARSIRVRSRQRCASRNIFFGG